MTKSPTLTERQGDVVHTFGQESRSWVKARYLAGHLELSPHEVGHALSTLRERGIVEPWNANRSSDKTWRLVDDEGDD